MCQFLCYDLDMTRINEATNLLKNKDVKFAMEGRPILAVAELKKKCMTYVEGCSTTPVTIFITSKK